MDNLDVFMVHRIVGGLKPGALPHDESLWCVTFPVDASERSSTRGAAQPQGECDSPSQDTRPRTVG